MTEYENSYEAFASIYDTFMSDIDYDGWCEYIHELLKEYGIESGLVLELGCGTGSLTERLSERGYDMIGVDSSGEMLQKAMEKKEKSGHDILYLLQDMREFELYGTVRAVVSICDSMNYITDPEDLLEVFRLVNNYLDPGGVFIFDLNTLYKYQTVIGDATIAEDRDEGSFIWENYYDEESRINEYSLSLFLRRDDGLYEKHMEVHHQKAYTLEEVQELLKRSGLSFLAAYDAFTHEPVKEHSERIYVIAQENGKTLNTEN